jgi:hypothetical protein
MYVLIAASGPKILGAFRNQKSLCPREPASPSLSCLAVLRRSQADSHRQRKGRNCCERHALTIGLQPSLQRCEIPNEPVQRFGGYSSVAMLGTPCCLAYCNVRLCVINVGLGSCRTHTAMVFRTVLAVNPAPFVQMSQGSAMQGCKYVQGDCLPVSHLWNSCCVPGKPRFRASDRKRFRTSHWNRRERAWQLVR